MCNLSVKILAMDERPLGQNNRPDFEEVRENLYDNVLLFLRVIFPDADESNLSQRVSNLLEMEWFQSLYVFPFDLWVDMHPGNAIGRQGSHQIYLTLFQGTHIAKSYNLAQTVLMLGVLRDLCYNPLVPVEYLMALKRERDSVVAYEREDVLLWYLSALLDVLETAEGASNEEYENNSSSVREAIEGIRGLIVSFTKRRSIANLQLVESSCRYWADRVRNLPLKLDCPNLDEIDEQNLPRHFDRLRIYILYRARRFLRDWHQLSSAI